MYSVHASNWLHWKNYFKSNELAAALLRSCKFFLVVGGINLLKRFFLSIKQRETFLYLVFGVLTTAVNWAVCLPLHYKLELSAAISNDIAWFVSVLFAYVTNKIFVFQSCSWKLKTVGLEVLKFFGARFLTGRLETGILSFTVDYLGFSVLIWKLIASIIVIVLNYVFSKVLIFRKKSDKN